jgi:hypothetical protein
MGRLPLTYGRELELAIAGADVLELGEPLSEFDELFFQSSDLLVPQLDRENFPRAVARARRRDKLTRA